MLGVDFAIKTNSVFRAAHLIAVCADLEWLFTDGIGGGNHVEVGCAETLTIATKAVAVATLVARWVGAVMVLDRSLRKVLFPKSVRVSGTQFETITTRNKTNSASSDLT